MIKLLPCICGCDTFVMRQTIKGYVWFRTGAYGEDVDNSEMYEGTITKDCWKYYRCEKCGKRAVEVTKDDCEV